MIVPKKVMRVKSRHNKPSLLYFDPIYQFKRYYLNDTTNSICFTIIFVVKFLLNAFSDFRKE